ncbi:bifunctional hydroxymethylpyrimidine kinase/phosphomethylpyrimidine kinase [Halorarum salinum]|uniref:Bifunctional hydroxymethylpyrimidine kinase/phosphomethylpyrimidine kinase n=1 Tax=Halorarum salinum TaxID=2743089 RepID=A0A7D5LCQ7_9EURY|nr:bifunctional hydroxymethylpyrimidine kinase/phosphomethylpyrimidine kinase [Halobaculum salinum]QLG63672.1 bifunctional hydroxymethylpyrimidine kinase/phosphomethylpyrimidine kinase [Halobaculum salinum]
MARNPAPDARPVALTIAGSDSGGGAGIQADLKTMEAGGAFGTSAVTAVTAQNTRGVESSHVLPVAEIEAQIDAVLSDFDVRAVKTGMLATEPIVASVADVAADLDAPLVVDPVMVAATGDRLLDPDAEDEYETLLAHATLATPNADEAEVLTGVDVEDRASAVEAGEALLETGVDAALVKGGHVPGDRVRDVLVAPEGVETFEHPRVDTDATHGSGCTLASAIATRLAHGDPLVDAVAEGVSFLERAVRYHLDVGEGPGSVHHLVALRDRAARQPTGEAVEEVVRRFVEADVSPLVPEVGMNVVAATPYAEDPGETAAVEGRITRTLSGVKPNRGVRFGASSHVARFLLSAREFDPSLRFAVNCRFDDRVERALGALDGPAVELDRTEEPDPDVEGSTMGWLARRAVGRADGTPAAVYDRGDVGKEAVTRVLAPDAGTAVDRVLALAGALPDE